MRRVGLQVEFDDMEESSELATDIANAAIVFEGIALTSENLGEDDRAKWANDTMQKLSRLSLILYDMEGEVVEKEQMKIKMIKEYIKRR